MRVRTMIPVLLAVIFGMPLAAAAQDPVKSFDQLNTRLIAGDTVWVTDADGREIKGKIRDMSATSLLVDAGGAPHDFPAARVGTIRIQPRDSLKNGVLWGALVGFVAGALSCGANPQCAGDESGAGVTVVLAVMGGGAGAGIGAAVDGARKGPKLVIYRAPGSQTSARVSLAPVITPRAKGAALTFAF